MAVVVANQFRGLLRVNMPTSLRQLRTSQSREFRTSKAVDVFDMRIRGAAKTGQRDVASALPSNLGVTLDKVDMGHGRIATVVRRGMVSVPTLASDTVRDALTNIDLVVYDMAGTVVEEGGLVYQTLRRVMVEDGMDVSERAMHPWHGAKKEAVIAHFARQGGTPDHAVEDRVARLSFAFEDAIMDAYFGCNSKVRLIDNDLMKYFVELKAAGIKIGLDTGYPAEIQEGLVKKLGFDIVVDSYISSYDVPQGRPYPYMIHRLMERTGVMSAERVAKMGDSARDMEEGRNAGCGLVVGVLSGADSAECLLAAGADIVVPSVMDLPAPRIGGSSL